MLKEMDKVRAQFGTRLHRACFLHGFSVLLIGLQQSMGQGGFEKGWLHDPINSSEIFVGCGAFDILQEQSQLETLAIHRASKVNAVNGYASQAGML